ncbi:MAG: cation-transporting P-type ATPase [Patescibacteria group bacterium]|nr:cation-transporting P-type ATPase [Patescibacteria group bacterium]
MQKERVYAFHQWSVSDVKRHFNVDLREGLSSKRAYFRHQKYGPNAIESVDENTVWKILLSQFSNFFIFLLFIAAIISYFVDGLSQSLILLLIIFFNVALGFFQEFKAEKALQDLKGSFKSKSKVLRDSKIRVVDSENITPGDIIVLEEGDLVPADIRVIESQSLRINEASLTGESLPLGKYDTICQLDTSLADRRNMLYGSTLVVAGRGRGIVVGIGKMTEFGRIAELVSSPEEKTPLEKQIAFLGKILTAISVVIVLALFILGQYRGYEILPLLTFTIALLIGAVPESLPTIITLSLAIGVSRMAKRKAIVRRMAVIETLGTTNIIATDKTGTITNNLLSVDTIAFFDKGLKVVRLEDAYTRDKLMAGLFEKALLCSNINMKATGELVGDPLEVSIAEKAKSLREGILTRVKLNKRLMEVPFDSEKKFMAVLIQRQNGDKEVIAKGAPEKILSFCKIERSLRDEIKKTASKLSEEGLKVIAVASRKVNSKSFSTLENLNFVGLFGLVDEPSEGIKEAIEKTIQAGIRPIMITGDHPETARYIANKVGMNVLDDEVISGSDLEKLGKKELVKALKQVKIFARVTPADKINIVSTLEKLGYSVAVTGDGVNDAPAIKRASAGIAMGIRGSDVAKESSDIILSDDKYATVISAIEYGRAVYDNIRNAIIFLLSNGFNEIFLIGLAFIFDLPVPLLTVQILWINMVTDSLPALALAFENPSLHVLREKPRSALGKSMKQPIIYALLLSIVGFTLGLFVYLYGLHYSVDKARTLVFTFAVFQQLVFIFSIRSPLRFWQSIKSFFANKYMTLSIIAVSVLQLIIFAKPFSSVFSIVPLNFGEVVMLLIVIIISFFAAEIIRWSLDRKHKKTA